MEFWVFCTLGMKNMAIFEAIYISTNSEIGTSDTATHTYIPCTIYTYILPVLQKDNDIPKPWKREDIFTKTSIFANVNLIESSSKSGP